MGASPSQFDHVPGFDLSSVASASQEQVMQALRQLGPLSNIGGIIVMSGGGGTDWPGTTNNPRFLRYIWIDTYTNPPSVKIHDQSGDTYADWISFTVAANSVTDASVAAGAAIAITKLATGTARYLIRTNAGATALEFVNPNAIFNASELPRSAIDVSLAPAGTSYLQRDASGGVTSWQKPTFADISGTLGIGSIAPSGTNNQVLATIAGATVWDEIQDILVDGALPINKLVSGTALQVLRRNLANSANEWAVPIFSRQFIEQSSNTMDVDLNAGANNSFLFSAYNGANDLNGSIPKSYRITLVCVTNDGGYLAGQEVPIEDIYDNTTVGDERGKRAMSSRVSTSTARVCCIAGTISALCPNNDTVQTITRASWKLKLYAYA